MGVVDEVKERLDIVEYVGRHVSLQKAGRAYRGLCPFHTEKTPSFYVFPDSQRWHCFGCNRGGDIFSFAMEFEGLDFRTALEELARLAGVALRPLTPEQVRQQGELTRLRALLEQAADYYHRLLLSAPQAARARAYLEQRGFTPETVKTFRLGYSLNSWDALRTHLLGQGFTVEELVKAGMLVQREDGRTYDRFRHRLMIPICDRRGRVIAFGGRVLDAEAQPKYINSPQTPLFDKGQVLFGYHLAAQAIREAGEVVLVEGYMDVMIPHQAGYRNVVAPMGTALTEAHLKQLQRLTRRFILALDPDAAGIRAVMRGVEVAREALEREWHPIFDPRGLVGYEGRLKAEIRVVTLPDGLDPDELVLRDPARWAALIARSQPVVRFYFEQLLQQENPHEPKGKARIVDAMLPLLSDISNGVEREAYAQEIALRLGLDARTLLDRLRVRERAQAVRRRAAGQTVPRPALTGDMEAYILSTLMHHPELLERVDVHLAEAQLPPLGDGDFSGTQRLIWSAWLELGEHPELELEELLPPDAWALVQQWFAAPAPDTPLEQLERDVVRTVLRLRERQSREMMRRLHDLVTEAQQAGDLIGVQYAAVVRDEVRRLALVQHALAQRAVATPGQGKFVVKGEDGIPESDGGHETRSERARSLQSAGG